MSCPTTYSSRCQLAVSRHDLDFAFFAGPFGFCVQGVLFKKRSIHCIAWLSEEGIRFPENIALAMAIDHQ
ncbi:MAG: hypothetical protein P8P52_05175 [Opitutae bacterium]|nr:hypothetical protein [Opitutae bacterium]